MEKQGSCKECGRMIWVLKDQKFCLDCDPIFGGELADQLDSGMYGNFSLLHPDETEEEFFDHEE